MQQLENSLICEAEPPPPPPKTNSDILVNKQYTSELIAQFNNLNKTYRAKAYQSLESVKEIQNMHEFKLKLLFSVVIVRIDDSSLLKFIDNQILFCFNKVGLPVLSTLYKRSEAKSKTHPANIGSLQ